MSFDLSIIGVKKNIPKVNFTSYSGLFVAPPKFGKTTTASNFPNSIIVPFEDGVKGQVANVVEDVNSWGDFIRFVNKLEENREEIADNVKTIVFDTVNKAYDMCEPYALSQLSKADKKIYKKPSDVPHGQFYPTRDKVFAKEVDRILKLGFAILFISHSKVKTIRPKNAEPYDVYSSTMPDRLEAIVNPLVDFILYGERRVIDGEPKRVLVTKGTDLSDSGSRVRLDDDIVFDTEEEAMQKYQEEFKKKVIETLREKGITDDYEELSKRQEEEKMEEVKKYVSETKSKSSMDDIVSEITSIVKGMTDDQQKQVKKAFKEELGSVNYKAYGDTDKLERALQICNEVVSD